MVAQYPLNSLHPKFRRTLLLAVVLFATITALWSASLETSAAQFVCQNEQKAQLARLAVFTFTDRDGSETDESQEKTTTFMSALAAECAALTVIDKSHESQVLDEIALSQSGIVDEKTMLTPDQLIGADSMLFGILQDGALELRLLEAKSGKILSAQIFKQPAPEQDIEVAETSPDDDYYMKRWLVGSAATQPELYLYVTSTPEQWNILSARYPYLESYAQSLPPERVRQINAWRQRVGVMREQRRLPMQNVQAHRHLAVQRARETHFRRSAGNAAGRTYMRPNFSHPAYQRPQRQTGGMNRYQAAPARHGGQYRGNRAEGSHRSGHGGGHRDGHRR